MERERLLRGRVVGGQRHIWLSWRWIARLCPASLLGLRAKEPCRVLTGCGRGSDLLATAADHQSILRGVPNKLKLMIVRGLLVDTNGRLVSFAADPDDVAANEVGGI